MRFLTIKNSIRMVLSASLLALAACTSGPEVHAELDRTADFSQYRTFAFISPLGTDRDGYQSIVSQYLKAATQRELEARRPAPGYQRTASADQFQGKPG